MGRNAQRVTIENNLGVFPPGIFSVEDALNHLATKDLSLTGMEGMAVRAGLALAGAAPNIVVEAGSCVGNNGSAQLITVAAPITIAANVAANQNSDGAGGAFAAPAAGTYIGVHVILDNTGTVRAEITNVPAVAENAVATLGAADVCSKCIAVIPVQAGVAVMHDTLTHSLGGETRRTTFAIPSGDLSAAAGTALTHLAAANGDVAIELPGSDRRRPARIIYVDNSNAGAGTIADVSAVGNGGAGGGANTIVSQNVTTENGAAALTAGLTQAEVITAIDGQSIALIADTSFAHRISSYDTEMI